MIKTLSELAQFTQKKSIERPDFIAKEIRIEEPGCTETEIQAIKKYLPLMPDSYLEVIRQLNLKGKCIHYFHFLSDSFDDPRTFAEQLIAEHQVGNMYSDIHEQDKVYGVGGWESLSIAVAYQDDPFRRDQIILYDMECAPEEGLEGFVLAENFKQLLILAGNLSEIFYRYRDQHKSQEALLEFQNCLNELYPNRTPETSLQWDMISKELLLDDD